MENAVQIMRRISKEKGVDPAEMALVIVPPNEHEGDGSQGT
jgi:hypothetical protein